MRRDLEYIHFDDQQLRAIIWCMNKLDSEYLATGNNGCYLDEYEKKLLDRLKTLQTLRNQINLDDAECKKLTEKLRNL